MKNERTQDKVTCWRMAILAVVAIACSQLALAGHQFEHDLGNAADACALCAGLQDLDAPPAASSSLSSRPTVTPAIGLRKSDPPDSNVYAPYFVRGPPRRL